jgi:hypothetical protein
MSKEEATTAINRVIIDCLQDKEVRKNLDSEYHILDISLRSLEVANNRGGTSPKILWSSYWKFFVAVRSDCSSRGCVVSTLETALEKLSKGRGVCLIGDNLLACRNFNTARDFISKISETPELIDDPSFGQSYRERTLSELQTEYDIPATMDKNLSILKGKAYIQANGRIGQIAEVPNPNDPSKPKHVWFEEPNLGPFSEVAYYNSREDELNKLVTTGPLLGPPSFAGAQVTVKSEATGIPTGPTEGSSSSAMREITIYIDKDGKRYPFIKRNRLSVLDLGHAYLSWSETGRTPLGEKLARISQQAINFDSTTSAAIHSIINKYQKDLNDHHSTVKWTFYNGVPSSGIESDSATTVIKMSVGYVVLTVQHHKQNNALAVHEGRIRDAVEAQLINLIKDIPGSNTISQDIVEGITNRVLKKLGGKPRKLKPHIPIKDKVYVEPIIAKATTTAVSGPKKTKKSVSGSRPPPIRISSTGRFVSLISLQNLLNQNLASQIQQNMGIGARKDILNYRSGRLAGSATVEKMSASREGMITAFYSYMRNPYATFSVGGAQSNPASRDPKLLISKSIREIGATMVGNRMRAVLV